MKIEIGEKKYIAPRPKAKFFREALLIAQNEEIKVNISADKLDELVDYVVRVFGEKFTIEEVYDEFYSDELIKLISDTIAFVVGEDNISTDKKK